MPRPVLRPPSGPSIAAALAAVAVALPTILPAQTAPTHQAADRLHHDPTAYMAALDDPARDAWQKPHEVLVALGLREGQRVADIGAGSGYFALRFARHVGAGGRIFAVDISRDMLAEVEKRAAAAALVNVTTVLAAPDDPKLAPRSADIIFVCDTWHHIERRAAYLAKLKSALAPGGRLVIVDFHEDAPVGPPRAMKLTRDEVVGEAEAAGFQVAREHAFLPHQYFLEFVPR
jgi:SAM-dependent methyltransferase